MWPRRDSELRIVLGPPPNFGAIDHAFKVAGKPILFAYGETIFNPMGIAVSPALIAHERVHGARQTALSGGAEAWWQRYIADPAYRLAEETPAHQAEYRHWLDHEDSARPVKGYRSLAEFHLVHIAKRLASPLYGGLIGLEAAKKLIRDGQGAAR